MKKMNKKILRRLLCVTSALVIAGGITAYSIKKSENKTIATLGYVKSDMPVIVLDAGHGGCS